MRRLPAIALLLAACLTTSPARDVSRTIYASNEMAPDCTGAVVSAVEKLRSLGVPLDLVLVPLLHRVFLLEPREGEVSVRSDFAEDAPISPAITYAWLSPSGGVERAEIVLQECGAGLVLRELALAVSKVPSESRRDPRERPLGH